MQKDINIYNMKIMLKEQPWNALDIARINMFVFLYGQTLKNLILS
jgi:hypothetical protein